jgi:hypothetical protein
MLDSEHPAYKLQHLLTHAFVQSGSHALSTMVCDVFGLQVEELAF